MGEEGLKKYKKNKKEIDCILLDFGMPVMSGEELFQKLKEIDETIKVIFTSGSKREEQLRRLKGMGKVNFLKKPFTLKKLSKAVAKVLGFEK